MCTRWLPALAVLGIACGAPPPESQPPPVRLGLWILAEGTHRTLEDPTRVDRLTADAQTLGATDLFVQVHRGGRSWYPSTRADDAPYRQIVAAHQVDPLRRLIGSAHARGQRVHAWFNALSLARNAAAPVLETLGPGAVLVDREGRNLLDYPDHDVPIPARWHTRLGTPGIWLDPAAPGVIEYLEGALDDLIAAAPDLDGLHLDFIRHPIALPIVPGSRFDVGLDFGYGAASKQRFAAENGGGFRRGDAWDAFRRERVSDVVRRLRARLPPGWELSAAVLPWADRAYLAAMQDWRGWLESGELDFAVAMAYTRDDTLLRYVAHGLRGGVGGDRVWIGLGTWLFADRPERARAQVDIALAPVPAGIALFSYDALAAEPKTLARLRVAGP